MENLPLSLSVVFIAITVLTAYFLAKASPNPKIIIAITLVWLGVQGAIGLSGFYTDTSGIPPRFMLLIGPPFLSIILIFLSKRGKSWLDQLNTGTLTLLHSVRFPVEIVLYYLCLHEVLSPLMTFEGRNFDIFSGITAPIIFYFGYVKMSLPKSILIVWNIVCLGLLINVVTHAILSLPTPFQQLSFEQPTIAPMYFPFLWLPGYVVPVVLFSQLVSLRNLLKR